MLQEQYTWLPCSYATVLHQPRRRVHFSAVDSVIAEQEAIADAVEDQLSVVDHLDADLEAKLKSAQSLRQSLLRHAFEGKLVPQDSTDEPAPELLKRIAEQRKEGSRMESNPKASKRPRKTKRA